MFEKIIDRAVNKRLDLLEKNLQVALTAQVDAAFNRLLMSLAENQNGVTAKLAEVSTKVDTLTTNAFTPEKLVETLRDSTSSFREDLDKVIGEIADQTVEDNTQNFITSDNFDPGEYDILTRDNFDASDFDCVSSDSIGDLVTENVDVDDITNQVIEKIREALGAKS